MGAISFFRESLKNLKTVGTVTRSSPALCREAAAHVDYHNAKVIVELGAGDGVITRHILAQMRPDTKLLAFEVLPKMVEKLRKIDDPRLVVIPESAEKMGVYLKKHGFQHADAMVSAVPFVALPNELAYRIVRESRKHLCPKGTFAQVHYALSMMKMYQSIFSSVEINRVLMNLPPAYVLVCRD